MKQPGPGKAGPTRGRERGSVPSRHRQYVEDALAEIRRELAHLRKREAAMAGEIERLEAAVAKLSTSVDTAIAFIGSVKTIPARADAAAATIESKTAELDAAVAP